MTEPSHSKFSASAADRWLNCPGSVVLSTGKPDSTSTYAARGTVGHLMLEKALLGERTVDSWLGETVTVDRHDVEVDDDLVRDVEWALNHTREITTGYDIVGSEQRVNYASWLNVEDGLAFGTVDIPAVHVAHREMLVADYKSGRKPVSPIDNPQLMLYAGGLLPTYEDVADIERVRMVILQPDAGAPKEHVISVDELKTWLRSRARSGAASVQLAERMYADAADGALTTEWVDTFLNAGDHCQWCKAKPTCPKRRGDVLETVFATAPALPEEFENMAVPAKAHVQVADSAWLAVIYPKLDAIEDWCKSVLAEIERRNLAGDTVPGTKLVAGKRGARAWANKDEAEARLKAMRLKIDEMYDLKVISPTTAEKLTKGDSPAIGPRQWKGLQDLITQSEGKPHVAPESDPRSALIVQPVAEMFEVQADDMV